MRTYYTSSDKSGLVAYDELVTSLENFPEGHNWANPIKKLDEDIWAIEKHPDHEAQLETITEEYLFQNYYPEP